MTEPHGVIALSAQACTSCMLCAKECPSWCIEISSHTETEPGPGRSRTVNVLDAFTIDYGLCMYCGICIEVCPFDALQWEPDYDYAAGSRAGLRQGIDALEGWWRQR